MEENTPQEPTTPQPEEVAQENKPAPTEQEFVKEYKALCERMGYALISTPVFRQRDDGTFSIVVQTQVGKVQK